MTPVSPKQEFTQISPAEYAAMALVGIALASATAFLRNYLPVPQWLPLLAWGGTALVLCLGLARAFSHLLLRPSLASLLFSGFLAFFIFEAATQSTSTGFTRHDEIYSWSMWAVQHFMGQPYDTYYTQAPYPQLFPYELASVFLAQGHHVSHFFAKLVCALPAIIMAIACSGLAAGSSRLWANGLATLLLAGALYGVGPILFFGYADPLASALLLVSFLLVLEYSTQPHKLRPLVLSMCCGLLAGLCKQPALIWCFFTLPLLVVYGVWRWQWKKSALLLCLPMLALAGIWPFFVASGFTHNQGVLDIAKNNGGLIASFLQSVQKYIIDTPETGGLLLASLAIAAISAKGRVFWVLCVLPYIAIWFILGSYEPRHGLHAIFISAALASHVLVSKYPLNPLSEFRPRLQTAKHLLSGVAAIAVLAVSAGTAWHDNAAALQDGNKAIFISQFGNEATPLYDEIIQEQRRIYATSNYQYGAFFGRTPMVRLAGLGNPVTTPWLFGQIEASEADFVLGGGEWTYGPYYPHILELAALCPTTFLPEKINTDAPYFSIYRVDRKALAGQCKSLIARVFAQ